MASFSLFVSVEFASLIALEWRRRWTEPESRSMEELLKRNVD